MKGHHNTGSRSRSANLELAMAGYRALDLTDEKGLLCGKLLGDLGVDVIKVERPGGDATRKIGPFYRNHRDSSIYWWTFNANKRGITLDITRPEGQEIFRKLAETADFVIESFPPGYLQGLHLAYEDLSQADERLILTSITPFGQTGPKANDKVCDLISWASGGAMYCCGDADRAPLQLIAPQSYLHAGAEAAAATLIAHYYREMSGQGQLVDVSIQESVIGTLMDTQEMWSFNKYDFIRSGTGWTFLRPDGGSIRQANALPCKDGWVACFVIGGAHKVSGDHLKALVQWMDEEGVAPEWLKNFDWVHDYQTRGLSQATINKVEGALTDFLMTKTKQELFDEAAKRRLLIAPVRSPKEVVASDQFEARSFWERVEHPELDETITYCGAWARMGETPIKIRQRAPLVGEHNEEIYIKEMGMSKAELSRLRRSGVI